MAENGAINLKVFLRDGTVSEARRFTVDIAVVTNFVFMKEKLQTVFPILRETKFKITWKDMDGDEITIASDEDFITALTEMSGGVKTLYATVIQHIPEPTVFVDLEAPEVSYHGPRIICDVCNQAVTGFRYKCLQCPDYDLCAGCEHQGHHGDHIMMRVPNTDMYMPKCARKFMHHVTKNLKKSAYAASKEAYRAAKFASKFGTAPRCGGEGARTENGQSDSQPSGSKQDEEATGCPFNMHDVHALGAMARQHFGPLLETLQATPAAQPGNAASNEQGGVFMDMLRNAVDGFFGRTAEDGATDQQEKQSEPTRQEAEKQPSTQQTADNGQTNPAAQTNPGAQTTPAPQTTPMDTEVPPPQVPQATLYPTINTPSAQPDTAVRRDPGWTFVATTPPKEGDTNTAPPANQPTAPTFVYHENPRIAEGLVRLHEMGFSNESGFLTHLLERYEGNVAAVVKAIVDMKI